MGKELRMDNGDVVDADECDHELVIEATDHDDAPNGAQICTTCGTRVDTADAEEEANDDAA